MHISGPNNNYTHLELLLIAVTLNGAVATSFVKQKEISKFRQIIDSSFK